jgi:hypothetical protein
MLQTPTPLEVAKRDVRLAAALLDIDETTGRCREIERSGTPVRRLTAGFRAPSHHRRGGG